MGDEESPPGAFAIGGPGARRGSSSSLVICSSVRASQSDPVRIDDAHLVALDEENAQSDNMDGSHRSSNTELVEGKALGRRQQDKQGHWIGWVAIVGCAVLAVVLMLVFLLGRSDGKLTETLISANSNFTQDKAPYPPFHDDLPALVTTGILEHRDSPFYHANQWVMKDPNFSTYSKERNLQRFYLAMMFYATNGDSWLDYENWLSYEVSECNWFTKSSFATSSKYYEANVCEDNTVINLSLSSNNLTGTFPIWYTYFIPSLKILDLSYNSIVGALPQSLPLQGTSELGQLSHLKKLDLTDTPVTGKVPVEVCKRVQEGQLELLVDCGTLLECCAN
ncbi:unknown protein [Seminavis robusta]|uniref:Uncharacterized protein n=1 Tax=Seminavis robusta TaxID=568900 RepID=A0A9N8DDA1_9STRA|nr:unknown protein [Seminavis robusta]|eukprot:Sro89_g046970.1 n/a (336) ;mRNA; f:67502-68509